MLELMSNVAPLGFERFSPLVNPLEVAMTPPPGQIHAGRGVEPTTGVAALKLENKGTGRPHPEPGHMARVSVERKIPNRVHSAPNGMALLSPADGRVLLEAQAAGAS